MSIVIFIIVLAVLIFVHELGHFLAAKSVDVRVDEFGLGLPPRATGYKPAESETTYSLNWIPFGGFVKIFGEDPVEAREEPGEERSLINRSKLSQVWVLAAGVIFNLIFAWVLISIGFMSGLPMALTDEVAEDIEDVSLTVLQVLPDSPAEEAGLASGDRITELAVGEAVYTQEEITVNLFQEVMEANVNVPVTITYRRGEVTDETVVAPVEGIVTDNPAIGVSIDMVGTVALPPHEALWEGAQLTTHLTQVTAVTLGQFVVNAFSGNADFSQVAGPVGIVSLVGDATELGFVYLLSFTAFISINLAIINLIPFPALDGGRILFVIIEVLKGSPIKPKVAQTLNTIGFALLILLMIAVTFNDIVRLIAG